MQTGVYKVRASFEISNGGSFSFNVTYIKNEDGVEILHLDDCNSKQFMYENYLENYIFVDTIAIISYKELTFKVRILEEFKRRIFWVTTIL